MELRVSRESGLKLYSKLTELETKFHEEHLMKHPADVLEASIEKLCFSLKKLLSTRNIHGFDDNKGKAICDHFLEVDSFYDRLFLIMKALSPVSGTDNKDAILWLKENNHDAYSRFKDSTAKAHKLIRKVSNGIKHDSLSVEYLILTDHRNREVDGFYFAKTVGEKELQGPCKDIHDDYKGSSTAISYDYFIRYTAGFVALCLFHLDKIFFKKVKNSKVKFLRLYQFFEKQKDVGDLVFPNEYGCNLADFRIENFSVIVKFPSRIKKNNEVDKILGVKPLFKFNRRTNSSHNQWPYFKLLS